MTDLFDLAPRTVDGASREAYERIKPTLTKRELLVFAALHTWMAVFNQRDMTGGELAAHMHRPTTQIRPRLTGLERKGWIVKGPIRTSRVKDETRAHGYRPVVPLAAVERAKQQKG